MRPPGCVRVALLEGVDTLATPDHAPTVRELAAHGRIGYKAALETVRNLKRAGVLRIARKRKVEYRNCPVAEYARTSISKARPVAGWNELAAAWRPLPVADMGAGSTGEAE